MAMRAALNLVISIRFRIQSLTGVKAKTELTVNQTDE